MKYKRLKTNDIKLFRELMILFGNVFEDKVNYESNPPNENYIKDFLMNNKNIIIIAIDEQGIVAGGLAGYVLEKFEQERKEIFVYDLAVAESHRRKGVATELFEELKLLAKEIGAYSIFVQADKEDSGAIAFYRTLDASELEAHHYEIKLS